MRDARQARHDLARSPASDLATSIQPGTLVVIDEAGTADTLTLDRVIAYAVDRGAVVRLIGDDQQLAAIGAGGVLRDIATTHGALHLDELVRFADAVTCIDEVFDAWARERAGGRDCLLLAPSRELVRELNLRAQPRISSPVRRYGSPTTASPTSAMS